MAITGYNVLQDTKTIKDIKTKQDENSQDILNINEQLLAKVSHADLTPVTTTGTASAYIATIPTNMVEVTIVPHVNNVAGATLNGIVILNREGNPIEKDVLITNIPTKLVRVGNNFFIASGGGGKYDGIVKKLPLATQNNINMLNDINIIPALIPTGVTNTKDSSIMLIGNNLYYFGGSYDGSYILSKHKIDLGTGIVTTPSFSLPDYFTSSTGIEYQGKAYVFGGRLSNSSNNTIYLYDETLNSWTKKYTGIVSLSNRGILVDDKLYIDSGKLELQIFSLITNTITTKQFPNYSGGINETYPVKYNNEIYLFTGRQSNNAMKYDIVTNSFASVTSNLAFNNSTIRCAFISGLNIYIVLDTNKLLIYNPQSDTWSEKIINRELFEYYSIIHYNKQTDINYMITREIKGVSLLEVQ